MKRILSYFFIIFIVLIFFWQVLVKGLLPIPADTIVGLYHPYRDLYAKDYPRGITFKNFLITDPVRQQYPWKQLVVSLIKKYELPLWNPYIFSGSPLLANFQSGVFYPLNIIFFIFPFYFSWTGLIILQPILTGIFLYLYLRNLKLTKISSIFGSLTFSFCGFSVAWLEWGNILHTALWLPLILLSIDKIVLKQSKKWYRFYLLALICSFFAGHLQIFFYLFVFSIFYFLTRWIQFGRNKKIFLLFFILNSLFLILTSVQWILTLQFINLSLREIDQSWQNPGWFIPWQNLVQFVVPDFFGNPATLNYWGVWNYGEFIGYIGILSLILAFFAIFFRRDKKTLFYFCILILSLIFSLPTMLAKIPYQFKIPFIDTSQPTRLLFVSDFSLAVLSAFGFDYFSKNKRGISYILGLFVGIFVVIWFIVFNLGKFSAISLENIAVTKSNLILPTSLFILIFTLIISYKFFSKKNKDYYSIMLQLVFIFILIFDLFRFGWKFTPFVTKQYLFPQTKTTEYLQKHVGIFRIMATDSTIFPPNFSTIYHFQSVDGYDPLYLQRYGELIIASERKKADITPPFGFNRIITPHNYESRIMDLLGVKYVLSLSVLSSPKLNQVFHEGQTIVYKNNSVMPRAFFVKDLSLSKNKEESMKMLFDSTIDLTQTAIVEDMEKDKEVTVPWSIGSVNIVKYSENKIIIDTENKRAGFLVLTDSFYPTWHVKIDKEEAKIYRTDYNFRGVIVPKGNHEIKFYDTL